MIALGLEAVSTYTIVNGYEILQLEDSKKFCALKIGALRGTSFKNRASAIAFANRQPA